MSHWSGDDLYFMRIAFEEAQDAGWQDEVPIGAVLVVDGAVMGRGHNSPVERNDPSAHAEILALRDAAAYLKNYRLGGSTLYVTLEPCLMCFGAILQARVGRVVYGAKDPKVGISQWEDFLASAHLNHRPVLEGGLLEPECKELLQEFFRRKRQQQG